MGKGQVAFTRNSLTGGGMALIKCPECAREISDKAVACPQCGFPIAKLSELASLPETVNCLDCRKAFAFNDEVCPHCGLFNSQKYGIEETKSSENKPKCPSCGSMNIEKISLKNKVGAGALFGVFAIGHVAKTFRCNNCKYKW